MDGGLLSLKWNNHRSTFLHVLSTVRRKESYCDATIACDGKFYPVHKLVLSTCSEYFEQMFECTTCRHPIIVLKDIRQEDLEALLNYMYVGEVSVLQNNLSGLIKAAEGLRIKGLAVPDESPVEELSQDTKRSVPCNNEVPESKRRRREKSPSPQKPANSSQETCTRDRSPAGYREPFRNTPHGKESNRGSAFSPSPMPVPLSPETLPNPSTTLPEANLDLLRPATRDLPISSHPAHSSDSTNSDESALPSEQEVKVDEQLVKEEPQEAYTEAEEEIKDSILDSEPSLRYSQHTDGVIVGEAEGGIGVEGGGTGNFGAHSLRPTNQPQTLEDLVTLPGSSGLQGKNLWEDDRSLLGTPYEGYTPNQGRPPQMGPQARCRNQSESLQQTLAQAVQSAHVCPVCGHLTRQKKDLKKHLRIHTGEKPYACPWCVYRSTQNSNLRTHIRRVHYPQYMLPVVNQQQSTQADGNGANPQWERTPNKSVCDGKQSSRDAGAR